MLEKVKSPTGLKALSLSLLRDTLTFEMEISEWQSSTAKASVLFMELVALQMCLYCVCVCVRVCACVDSLV